MASLVTKAPYRGFALALALFYPKAMRPQVCAPGATHMVDPTSQIEDGAEIQPGAIIGAEAQVGRGNDRRGGRGHRLQVHRRA